MRIERWGNDELHLILEGKEAKILARLLLEGINVPPKGVKWEKTEKGYKGQG